MTMEMKILKNVVIRCSKCNKKYTYKKDMLDPDESYEEGNMGTQIEHFVMDRFNCEKCSNRISFQISIFEYPVGAYDSECKDIRGAVFEKEPEVALVYDQTEIDIELAIADYERVCFLLQQIVTSEKSFSDLSSRDFEKVIEKVLIDEGYVTFLTQPTRDGGKDIVAKKFVNGKPIVFNVECKQYDQQHKVGVKIVREVLGVHVSDGVDKSLIVTTSEFSKDAKEFADKQEGAIELIDGGALASWIKTNY